MKHIKSVLEGVVSQGRLVGSRGYSFRASSSSNATGKHNHGIDIGASRNYAHEKAAKEKSAERVREREQAIEKRNKEAEKRQKEVSKMANEEEIQEAKRFVYDKPQSHLVKMYDKKPTEDLHAMHKRWSGDHVDKKSNPSRSEDLLAVHHVLKSRGQNPSELPQHKNLGMMRMHEETNTEKRMKIKNVARPGDPEPTSEKSTLSKTDSIKTKIVEEKPTMSLPNFGLPASLIAAARQIVEKKQDDNGDARKMEGGKTPVILNPETDDKINENDPKKKKHTTPKSAGEKKLAALAHPKDKITHKDVLVGRGVLRKEETEIEETREFGRKSFKATPVAQHTDSSGNKHSLWTRNDTGDRVYYNKTYPDGKVGNSHKGMEPTYDSKEKAMDAFRKHVKEEVDINALSEEQLDEISKEKKSAYVSAAKKSQDAAIARQETRSKLWGPAMHKFGMDDPKDTNIIKKRAAGIQRATKEEVELTAEELERIESIAAQLDEAAMTVDKLKGQGWKKTGSSNGGWVHHYSHPDKEHGYDVEYGPRPETVKSIKKSNKINEGNKPTIVSAPIRGANQPQSGFGVKNNVADYTISDEKKVRKEEVEELDESTLKDKITDKDGNRYELHLNVKGVSGHKDDHVIVQTHKNGKAIRKSDLGMLRSGGGNRYVSKDKSYIMKKFNSLKEEVELDEAIKIGSKVKVHAPGKDYHGVIGNVGEIDHGLHNKSEKRYTVDYNNRSKSVTVPKSQIKLHKEEVELEEGRGRPKKSGGEAEGDDTHKHPIQQLTKIAHAIEGSEPHFEHKDGSKSKIGKHLAKHVMAVYGSMRTSQDKDDFANKLHASKDSMKSAVSKLF